MKKVIIGMYGLGTVGMGVYRLIEREGERIKRERGVELTVKRILVSDLAKPRKVPQSLLTANAADIYNDPEITVALEAMGGVHPAFEYDYNAVNGGKTLVTANKMMLAANWRALTAAAAEHGAGLYFEASAMGGVPVIRTLLSSVHGNGIRRIAGVVNGTTNYMLSEMARGVSYSDALSAAQRLGYAEPDPTADVEGLDAAAKVLILGSLAFDTLLDGRNISAEGISRLNAVDAVLAARLGYTVKLVATAERCGDGVTAAVRPMLVKNDEPLANVAGVSNGIVIEGAAATLFLSGPGAGADATASAMVSDAVNAALESPRYPLFLTRPADPEVNSLPKAPERVYCRVSATAAVPASAEASVTDGAYTAFIAPVAPDGAEAVLAVL